MIEALRLRDFQRWEKLDIEFDPLVTVLVGPSDRGKSSVLRCLRWVCLNRPAGEAFIRHGAKSARAVLEVDGREVRRKKGESSNTYALDGQKFQAFGQNVPADIAGLLNLTELNFQRQHDPSYLFSKSPGEVSRELNQVINLSLIDDTLSRVGATHRSSKTGVSLCEERFSRVQAEYISLSWVEAADEGLRALEGSQATLAAVQKEEEALEALLGLVATQESLAGAQVPPNEWDALEGLAEALAEAWGQEHALESLLGQIARGEEEQCQIETSLERDREELVFLMGEACPLCQAPIRK